jgi:hydroxymethylglutaryl-CoA synthase
LNLPVAVMSFDVIGSQRAGTSALIGILEQSRSTDQPSLCAAAELRKARPASEAELLYGDAAAAFVVGRGDPVARFIDSHSVTVDFVDHFRSAGEPFDYTWESRWIREGYAQIAGGALQQALLKFKVPAAQISHAAIAVTTPGVAASLAAKAGIASQAVVDAMSDSLGDSGAAHPLLMLARALDCAQPGEKILLLSCGQGVDVLLFEATPALREHARRAVVQESLARRRPETNYLRYLFHRGQLDMERGMRAEMDQKQPGTTLFRNRKTVLALLGGRSRHTGAVQFPKTEIGVDPADPAGAEQEDYPLADLRAQIVSYTSDNLTYSPDPPLCYGMIDFEGGGRMTVEFADAGAGDLAVGKQVRMVFRIKALDETRSFKRYFWKATPIDVSMSGGG